MKQGTRNKVVPYIYPSEMEDSLWESPKTTPPETPREEEVEAVAIGCPHRTDWLENIPNQDITDEILYMIEKTPIDNPLQTLREQALKLSGLTHNQAFAIDESKISEKVGEYHVTVLMQKFYERVYEDPDEWFRQYFTSDMDDAVLGMTDYLVQRIGGAPNYSARKGFNNLVKEHEMFEMSERTAKRWLEHMQAALGDMSDEIIEKFRVELFDFMRYTAFYLVVSQSTQKHMESAGPYF